MIRKHIEPKWASVPLSKISHADVQAWVTELSRTQSPASVRKIHRVLSLILDMAVKDGRLARNVAAKINLPRPIKGEQRYLTHGQVEDLAHATGYPPMRASTAIWTPAPTRCIGSSCSYSPTRGCGSARWPR